jgi:hypothetical protein
MTRKVNVSDAFDMMRGETNLYGSFNSSNVFSGATLAVKDGFISNASDGRKSERR